MTTREADKIIAERQPVKVLNKRYNEVWTMVIVSRDRFNVRSSTGGIFERAELEVVK